MELLEPLSEEWLQRLFHEGQSVKVHFVKFLSKFDSMARDIWLRDRLCHLVDRLDTPPAPGTPSAPHCASELRSGMLRAALASSPPERPVPRPQPAVYRYVGDYDVNPPDASPRITSPL